MRIANVNDRLTLLVGDNGTLDVARASGGRFSPEIQEIYPRWAEFTTWAASQEFEPEGTTEGATFGPPVPKPGSIFAIGVNYREHAAEAGIDLPAEPVVFTKFPASVTGPFAEIALPSTAVDYEVELVVVIGVEARNVPEEDAWAHVAGITAGQDLSDRVVQLAGPAPQQFSMGKSFEGFAPTGPVLVTRDELTNPDDLEVATELSGEQMQKGRTSEFVFSIAQLVSYLSGVLPLRPGDLIFTGTPGGVGWLREPRRTIAPGDTLVTRIECVGEMRNTFVAR